LRSKVPRASFPKTFVYDMQERGCSSDCSSLFFFLTSWTDPARDFAEADMDGSLRPLLTPGVHKQSTKALAEAQKRNKPEPSVSRLLVSQLGRGRGEHV
jgi:hypothetical protein